MEDSKFTTEARKAELHGEGHVLTFEMLGGFPRWMMSEKMKLQK